LEVHDCINHRMFLCALYTWYRSHIFVTLKQYYVYLDISPRIDQDIKLRMAFVSSFELNQETYVQEYSADHNLMSIRIAMLKDTDTNKIMRSIDRRR